MKHANQTLIGLAKPRLKWVFIWQVVVLLVAVLASLMFFNWVVAYSVLIGGIILLVPNIYFAVRVFQYSGAGMAAAVMQSFYRAEAGKFILSLLLFAAVFSLVKPLNIVAVFSTYLFLALLHTVLIVKFKK